ncbi:GFA family protein [Alteriqipengyuania sp. 357]
MNTTSALSGHCLCGKVSIALAEPSSEVEICQCDMCRRWGGAFYAAQRGSEATVTGEDAVTEYKSSDWASRAFCKHCGSGLWFRFLPTGTRSFSAGLFDGATHHAIGKEIFVDERADWCLIKGDHPRQTGEEVIAEAKAAGFIFD